MLLFLKAEKEQNIRLLLLKEINIHPHTHEQTIHLHAEKRTINEKSYKIKQRRLISFYYTTVTEENNNYL